MKRFGVLLAVGMSVGAAAQLPLTLQPGPSGEKPKVSPLTQPTLSPGQMMLLELETKFAADVAKGGGKAFASWFAEDAVTLNNGKPAVLGLRAISASSVWDSARYQLTWTPEGAQMGPSGDTGFTWGHYEASSVDKNGEPVKSSGRYITFWKKVQGGAWKVALDASANDAPPQGACCVLPAP